MCGAFGGQFCWRSGSRTSEIHSASAAVRAHVSAPTAPTTAAPTPCRLATSAATSACIRHGLKYTDADSLIWSDEDIFPPGSYPLEVLENEVNQADFGVAIAHPDDIVRSRRSETAAPRDNVIFELGFFMSRLGRKRTILLVPKMGEDLKLPSDFKGLVPITYTPLTGKSGEVPGQVLAHAVYELEQKIQQLGCREL